MSETRNLVSYHFEGADPASAEAMADKVRGANGKLFAIQRKIRIRIKSRTGYAPNQ
jgi:hypothetical protein